MSMFNRILILGVLLVSTLLISCSKIERIYQNRADVLNTFTGVSIITRGPYTHLVFENDSIHDFIFEKINGKYGLKIDTANFELNFPINGGIIKFTNKPDFERAVEERFEFYARKMKEYEIINVSTQFKQYGIAIKFYLKDSELLYIPNVGLVIDQEWRKYIMSINKIDENWYWRKF